jgi:hypothetical protein
MSSHATAAQTAQADDLLHALGLLVKEQKAHRASVDFHRRRATELAREIDTLVAKCQSAGLPVGLRSPHPITHLAQEAETSGNHHPQA